jgi:uncharacterized protein YkwD
MHTYIKSTKTPHLNAWVMALSLTLSACGGGGSSTPTPTPTPSGTPTPAGSPSATPTPSGTPSATPTPSGTPAAAGTPSATPTPSGTPAASPTPTPTAATAVECPIGDYKSAVVSTINSIRSSKQLCNGVSFPAVGSLSWDGQLEFAAARHSNDMAINNFFSHVGSDGTTLRQRVPAAGYNYASAAENIGIGQSSVNEVFFNPGGEGWMSSTTGHCEAIMTAVFVNVGVSCKYSPAVSSQYLWTLELGKRQ